MRPQPVNAKPFFRPEAENYRRLRHLGEIELLRSLPLQIVAALPLLSVAVLGAIAMSIRAAPQVELMAGAVALEGGALELILGPGNQSYFAPGDRVRLVAADVADDESARVLTAASTACPPQLAAATRLLPQPTVTPRTCLALTLQPVVHAGRTIAADSIRSVRAEPRRYLDIRN